MEWTDKCFNKIITLLLGSKEHVSLGTDLISSFSHLSYSAGAWHLFLVEIPLWPQSVFVSCHLGGVCGLAAQCAGCSRNTQQKNCSMSQRVCTLGVAQEMVGRYKHKGGRSWKARTVLPSTVGSQAHCSDLQRSSRNFVGAAVTEQDVGLEGFVNKESLKLVLVGSLKGPLGMCFWPCCEVGRLERSIGMTFSFSNFCPFLKIRTLHWAEPVVADQN